MPVPFFPPTASSVAAELDWLYAGLLTVATLVLGLVFGLMIFFCVRYRRTNPIARGQVNDRSWRWEVGWTSVTFALFLCLYFWGADLFIRIRQPPGSADEIYVVAKQWMWKTQHAGGQAEINALHLAVNQPVRLVMTSQDVIHDFFVPAFRVKQDVLPGRYQDLWFRPTKTGVFALYCAEFCGTDHAHMGGQVTVMEPGAFAEWLQAQPPGDSLAQAGAAAFRARGCSGCHGPASTVNAPPLEGLFGRRVPLQDGSFVTADSAYIRDSILLPKAQIAAGYPPIMPSYAGQIGEDELLQLIAYIKSLGAVDRAMPADPSQQNTITPPGDKR